MLEDDEMYEAYCKEYLDMRRYYVVDTIVVNDFADDEETGQVCMEPVLIDTRQYFRSFVEAYAYAKESGQDIFNANEKLILKTERI